MSEYRRNWDREVVEEYIKPESQQKTPDIFRKTHVEINKIRAEILRPHHGDDPFVAEAQFRDAVLDSELDDDNRIFIIKGEVGSGKSHLCQWLEYEINGYEDGEKYDDTHVAIHISRSNTRLDEILEILHEPVDKEYEEVSDVSSLDPVQVADFIIQGLMTFYRNRPKLQAFELEEFLADHNSGDDFRTILINNIEEYQDSVESEGQEQNIKEYLLSRKDYGKVCFTAFGETRKEDTVYPFLRRAIHDLLTRNIGIEDFKGELEALSEAYKTAGKRPVLICEDLTTFSVLKDDLLDHIFELSSGNYDVILGWTTGWERENIDDALSTSEDSLTYMKQRSEGYLSMTDDAGQAYFLEGRSAPVVLVKRYLDAIKEHSEASADIPEDSFDGLYPFNAAFIRHVYANLVQDGNLQQTPRILLVHVVADCLTSDVRPFESIQNNAYVRQRPYLIEMRNRSDECLELTQWYAYQSEGRLWLPSEVFGHFGVDIEGGQQEDGYVFYDRSFGAGDVFVVDQSPGEVEIPESVDPPGGTTAAPGGPDSGSDITPPDPGQDTIEPEVEIDDQQEIPPEDYREFQTWLRHGAEYESVDRFREGVVAVLERWHDPTKLANENAETRGTTAIFYARGSNPPIYVRGADARSSMSFEIDHGTEQERLYREMLRHGYVDSFDDGANFDELRGWAATKVVDYRSRMRQEIENVLPADMTVEEFVVLSWFLVMNAGQGASDISRDLMFESYKLQSASPLSMESDLQLELPGRLDSTFTSLAKHSADLSGLVKGFFLLKENVLDHDRLSKAVKSVSDNRDVYISELAKVSSDDLADAYRLGSTRSNAKKKLSTVIKDVSNYAGELEKLRQDFHLGDLRDEVDRYKQIHQLSHTRQNLSEIFNRLEESLGPLNVAKRERWSEVEELLDDEGADLELDAFRETLEDLSGDAGDDPISIITTLYEYRKSHVENTAWQVYDAIAEMIEELEETEGADAGEFRESINDSEEFDKFRQQRDAVLNAAGGLL